MEQTARVGRPTADEPMSAQVIVRVTPARKEQIRRKADEQGMKPSVLMRNYIYEKLDADK